MQLLIVRHGKAEEAKTRSLLKGNDTARRLTEDGRKDMRKVAKGLRELVGKIDILATSPLKRAAETADIVAKTYGIKKIETLPLLEPGGDKKALIEWLKTQRPDATVAVVGHEPHLSALASLTISGGENVPITLKKGGCCLIQFESTPDRGSGSLLWLLQPGQLKKIEY